MIINEGIGDKPTSVYGNLINLKFMFSIICLLMIIIIFVTYDNNIYAGLGMISEYNDDDYKKGKRIILAFLIVFVVFIAIDIFIQISGLTYNFYKLTVINLSLKIFEVFLLVLFFLDSWHYFHMLYIFIFTQFFCTCLEIYSIIFNLCSTFKKYNKIRNL